jgi:hypothetical protein
MGDWCAAAQDNSARLHTGRTPLGVSRPCGRVSSLCGSYTDRLAYGEQGVSSISSLAPRPAPGLGALTVGGHVVPKHRRSEIEQSRASFWGPANTAEDWPEAVGYGQFGGSAGPMGMPEPGWAASPQERSWQELEEWQSWGPPAMHPDHPSAPVPRVQFSDDYPSGPMPAPRASGAHDLPHRRPGGSARTWNAPRQTPDAGFDNGSRRLYAVPDNAAAGLAGPDWPEPVNFQLRQGPSSRDAIGYQRQAFPGWQESSDYRPESGPFEPGRGPAPGRFRDGRTASRDSAAGQVLTLADGRAAQVTQEAQAYADAICDAAEREAAAITEQASGQAATLRDAAEREAATIREAAQREAAAVTKQATGQAATIREAAEREAAELRARLDSMTGELGRLAAYVTENLVAPGMPATAPALPGATPALPGTIPAPDGMPAKPGTGPAGPRTAPTSKPHEPGTRTAKPASAPGTRPGGPVSAPGTRPAKPARQTATPTKQGDTQGRQRRAMRIATAGTAALLSVAAVGAVTMTGIHGFKFFVFRESAQGETPGNFTDVNFLAGQKECPGAVVCPAAQHHDSAPKAAQHHDAAPKGRHHKAAGSK